MEETNAEVLKEVATKTEGVDETKVATKGDADGTGDGAYKILLCEKCRNSN